MVHLSNSEMFLVKWIYPDLGNVLLSFEVIKKQLFSGDDFQDQCFVEIYCEKCLILSAYGFFYPYDFLKDRISIFKRELIDTVSARYSRVSDEKF